jgi:hypothetical protein
MLPLSCRDVYLKAFDFVDGDLSLRDRAFIRFHLLLCGHCRRFVRQARCASDYVRRHPAFAPRTDEADAVADAILAKWGEEQGRSET